MIRIVNALYIECLEYFNGIEYCALSGNLFPIDCFYYTREIDDHVRGFVIETNKRHPQHPLRAKFERYFESTITQYLQPPQFPKNAITVLNCSEDHCKLFARRNIVAAKTF